MGSRGLQHRSNMKNVIETRTTGPLTTGLGDLIGKAATPIARALGMPCVDPETRQLRPESPCAKRKAALNAIIPDIRHPLDKARNK